MCISAAVVAGVSLVASAIGTGTAIMGANANKAAAKYENRVREKQLKERLNIEKLAAIESENGRRSEFARIRSAALAAIGASGLGENISFFQGADPEGQREVLRDIRNIRLGLVAAESSVRDEIAVGAYGVKIASYNAGLSKVSAIAQFAQDAMNAYTYASAGAAPSKPSAGKVGSGSAGGFGSSNGAFRSNPFGGYSG